MNNPENKLLNGVLMIFKINPIKTTRALIAFI